MSIQKATEIVKSWRNYVFQDKEIEKIAKDRADICGSCDDKIFYKILNVFVKDHNEKVQGYKCKLCNCPLSAMTRNTGVYKCKAGKWEK